MMPTEIVFVAEEAPEGGYTARAFGVSIFTEADSLEALEDRVRDAVRCHFGESERPCRFSEALTRAFSE